MPREEQRQCDAGHFCVNGLKTKCGSPDKYSTSGQTSCSTVQPGYFSTPLDNEDGDLQRTWRTGEEICPLGHYCIAGVSHECPRGTYGGITALTSIECSGPCSPIYDCPAGSTNRLGNGAECKAGHYCTSDLQECGASLPCGGVEFYCPQGSGAPVPVNKGYYTTPETPGKITTREDQEQCPDGYYCTSGRKRPCGSAASFSTPGATNCTAVSSGYVD